MNQKNRKRIMWIIIVVILIIPLGIVLFMKQPPFGRLPRGQRLERILKSPNYRDGKFQNLTVTEQITSDKSKGGMMLDFLFRKIDGLRPETDLPVVKTDLKLFRRDEDVLVWMGHSSFFIQMEGKRILVDPVFVMASPVSFVNRPFPGTNLYAPDVAFRPTKPCGSPICCKPPPELSISVEIRGMTTILQR